VGTFSVYGIMGQKHGRVEVQIGVCRAELFSRSSDMYYEELKQIIRSVLQQGLSGQSLMDALTANVNPTEIYASDDMLVTDSYFSLLHFATGEEMVTDAEWKYFLDCLNGNRVYNLEEKLQMTDKNSIDGSV
jgi:hypothetical protein